MKVVDPTTFEELGDGVTGELWISGPSVAEGYFGKEELSTTTFAAIVKDCPGQRFMRTGDLAFFQGDDLYICGRIKDLVIQNGGT
jgi:acyl-CoA synthetase (AMP-forming)/AMP-acid ligase II